MTGSSGGFDRKANARKDIKWVCANFGPQGSAAVIYTEIHYTCRLLFWVAIAIYMT
jgi:hypothetical protein